MRSLLLLIVSLLSGSVFGDNRRDEVTVEIKEIVFSIENLLSFVEKYYYQMNLDGVLGITLAQGKIYFSL